MKHYVLSNSWQCITHLFLLILLGFDSIFALFPAPASLSTGSGALVLDPNAFSFQTQKTSAFVSKAFDRYTKLIFTAAKTKDILQYISNEADQIPRAQLTVLQVDWQNTDETLDFGVDESYSLQINSNGKANLNAQTVFGVLRGLESFSQLVYRNASGSFFYVPNVPISINDRPRFSHRGLLIDSSRHFLPISTILRAIDGLTYNKFNVLHWHLVDAIAFPVRSDKYPAFSQGAYSPNLIYTNADIQSVINYGYERGIRVLAEFDTPGHAYSWGIGYPGITANCPHYAHNVNNIALNPAVDKMFQVVEGFLSEMAALFPDSYFHIGGDEVVYGCLKEDTQVQAWMKKMGFTNIDQVMQYYENRIWKLMAGLNKTVIAWEEVFVKYNLVNLPSNIVIEVWEDESTLIEVATANLRGMLAYGWYLARLEQTWKDFYNNEPFNSSDWTPQTEKLIIGGEVCAWGEAVDEFNFDQVLYPRTAAAGERLWSPRTQTDLNDAQARLIDFICVLNKRGIASGPIVPGFCA